MVVIEGGNQITAKNILNGLKLFVMWQWWKYLTELCTDIIDVNIMTKKVQDDNKNVRVADAWKNLIKNVRLDQPFVSKKE